MRLDVIGSSLLIVSAILYSSTYIVSGLANIVTNSLPSEFQNHTYSQPLFIWSLVSLVLGILFVGVHIMKKK